MTDVRGDKGAKRPAARRVRRSKAPPKGQGDAGAAARRPAREQNDGDDAAATRPRPKHPRKSRTGGDTKAPASTSRSTRKPKSSGRDGGHPRSSVRRKPGASRATQANGEGVSPSDPPVSDGVPVPLQQPRSSAQDHLYEAQRDLDSLLRDVDDAHGDAAARRRAAEAIGHIASRLHPVDDEHGGLDADVFASARQLVSLGYYARQWSRFGMRHRADEVDDFGLDRVYEQRVQPLLDTLFDSYFRVQVSGMDQLPAAGGALLVCNRGGALPWDGVMLKTAVKRYAPAGRELRWLLEDFNFHAPFLGPFLNRIGAVRACQANAERLLDQGSLIGVFPEGIKGVSKTYGQRYQLQRFGRGGHVKLALRRAVPIFPVAIVGAEDAHPLLFRIKFMAKAAGVPFVPVTPTFPWLGPAGLLPLPSRWRIVVGPPIEGLEREPEAAEDSVVVNELNERVRAAVQQLLDQAQAARGNRWV